MFIVIKTVPVLYRISRSGQCLSSSGKLEEKKEECNVNYKLVKLSQ